MQSEDASSESQSDSAQHIQSEEPVLFDWENKWLKGHQYAFILKHMQAYCSRYGFRKYPHKTHPQLIYENPQNGIIYFVEGKGVGSQFGFPRVQTKKKFRWKKMNFTTNLPKRRPQVTYVVASALKSQKIQENQWPLFRMHAVVLYGPQSQNLEYILCHVREMKRKKSDQSLQLCFEDSNQISFYKLFAYIHNFKIQNQQKK